MENKSNIQLTATEITSLWMQFMNDSESICVLNYFLEIAEDPQVRPIIEFALNNSKNNIAELKEVFHNEKFAIPAGFGEQDVDRNAPRLFSDTFIMMYIRNMSILGMAVSAGVLGNATRPDLVDFYKKVLQSTVELQDMARDLMLENGTYVKSPYIPVPDQADMVEHKQFLAGFLGDKRALTSIEITHLYMNIQTNALGKAIMVGFAQGARHEEVIQFIKRGEKIAQKHVDAFSKILIKESLPAPMSWDSAVTSSTTPVFSDKLMMYHVSAMIAAGIGNYGLAMAASPRRDIGMKYASFLPEIALYATDGANIMIKHGWMEQPPMAPDRDKLASGRNGG